MKKNSYSNIDIKEQLTTKERYFLRLITHGFETSDILSFLSLTNKNYFDYISTVKEKLNCKSWYQVTIKAFELKILDIEDYVDDLVKNQALLELKVIINNIDVSLLNFTTTKQNLLNFHKNCVNTSNTKKSIKISNIEKDFLKLKFSGLDNNIIDLKLKLTKGYSNTIQSNLFKRLNVNNYYNLFKVVFQYDLIENNGLVQKDINLLCKSFSNKIMFIKSSNSLPDRDKEINVYHELLKFYALSELAYLKKINL